MTEASNYFNNTLRYVLILAIPVIVYLSAIGKEIVRILSTSEFFSAIYIIPVMLITFIIFEVGIFYQRIVMLIRPSNIIMKVFGVGAVMSTVLNVILIPRFSIVGAAISLLVTYSVLFTIFYKLANEKLNVIAIDWILLLKCLLATIPGFLFIFLNKNGIYRIPLGMLAYLALLWIFGIVGKREWIFLRSLWYSVKLGADDD